MDVAKTIIDQLGGNQFLTLTGIKKCLATDSSVTFHLPRNAKQATALSVRLEEDDTYTVRTYKIRKCEIIDIESHEGIYCGMLQDLFEEMTGLFVTLHARR